MKRRISYLSVIIFIIGGAYLLFKKIQQNKEEQKHQAWVATLENTASKNVEFYPDVLTIDYRNEKRSLAIYLPEKYATDSLDYSVIYFMDGQSLFDQKILEGPEWQVDEALDSLGKLGQEQSIIVGIYNGDDRLKEYKPFGSDRWYSDKTVHGDQHAAWIVDTVKPWVDQKYRTKKEAAATTIGGASLGGLMAYYMLMEYPAVFGRAIVFSPSFWVHEKVYTLHEKNKSLFNQKIYFNAGQLETPTVESIEKMRDVLIKFGMPPENIKLTIEEGEGHWHKSWQKGFRQAYPWIVQ